MNKDVVESIIKELPKVKKREELDRVKKRISKKFGMSSIIINADIYDGLNQELKEKYHDLLLTKPTRSISGVSVVAVMTHPEKCPGNCIYCPKGEDAPQSYTGKEPAAMRGIMFNFEPFIQTSHRLKQLKAIGHNPSKVELIIMGGTFLSYNLDYQEYFITRCLQAMNSFPAKISDKQTYNFQYLKDVQKKNEKALARCVGMTFETRPDWCLETEIRRMLYYGGTRCELGVQSIYDDVLKKINRGHNVSASISATKKLKDSGFKVLYHIMPSLPGSSFKRDLEMFSQLFKNQDFKPDMLKIYPTSVIKGTELYKLYKKGEYTPPALEETAKLIGEAKRIIPKYCRIMRVQRDIPTHQIEAGIKNTNLRQEVKKYCDKNKIKCQCIRCREIGNKYFIAEEAKLERINYRASDGDEVFLSYNWKENIIGFIRLRIPGSSFMEQITNKSAIIRELHVYGSQVPVSEKGNVQHLGFGKKLLHGAEKIAKEEYDKNKMIIISGVGVREYYRKQGYKLEGTYMTKETD